MSFTREQLIALPTDWVGWKETAIGLYDTVTRLNAISETAVDLVELWKAQKVSSVPRAGRNAAIEETREKLIALLDRAA